MCTVETGDIVITGGVAISLWISDVGSDKQCEPSGEMGKQAFIPLPLINVLVNITGGMFPIPIN